MQRATEIDIGVYECRASNAAGSYIDSAMAQMSSIVQMNFMKSENIGIFILIN